ncbi:hypothetical protein T552_03294 [Pneumocystis carinii B80]|uniref:Uncharacterized protein n=1 Tax=Pneumocystis carinii (strain B80) TaxID=1408658 RepID=A0A0W4ZCB3_PNEC8|nr:hypothetical protein T552_03294 [Pneumocystis carinii B80]KTW26025.1 hypothetical protein T552_03294 [Pneumocystis carinii B80]
MKKITVNVKASNDKKYAIEINTDATIEEFKQLISSKTDITPERQRLIYSGRVLKDEEKIETYKISDGHTVHLVRGAGPVQSEREATSSTTAASQQIPRTISAGTGVNNPFSALISAHYAGQVHLPPVSTFGPDGGMTSFPPTPEQLSQVMGQQGMQEVIREMLSNSQLMDYIINSNPQLRNVPSGIQEIIRSEEFIRIMSNPETIRQIMEMQRVFGNMGMGAGNLFSTSNEPRTETASTYQQQVASVDTQNRTESAGPYSNCSENESAQQNPDSTALNNSFAAMVSLLSNLGAQQQSTDVPVFDPVVFQSFLSGLIPQQPPQPQHSLPPEERFQEQLRQLNELGFTNFDRNIRALGRSGGSVQGAIEAMLDGDV